MPATTTTAADGSERAPLSSDAIAEAGREVAKKSWRIPGLTPSVRKAPSDCFSKRSAPWIRTKYTSALLDCAHYFYLAANPLPGIPACIRAVEAARRMNHRPLLRKALTFVGAMHADTGDCPPLQRHTPKRWTLLSHSATDLRSALCSTCWGCSYSTPLNMPRRLLALSELSSCSRLRIRTLKRYWKLFRQTLPLPREGTDIGKAYRAINSVPAETTDLPKSVDAQLRAARESVFVRVLDLGDITRAKEHAALTRSFCVHERPAPCRSNGSN